MTGKLQPLNPTTGSLLPTSLSPLPFSFTFPTAGKTATNATGSERCHEPGLPTIPTCPVTKPRTSISHQMHRQACLLRPNSPPRVVVECNHRTTDKQPFPLLFTKNRPDLSRPTFRRCLGECRRSNATAALSCLNKVSNLFYSLSCYLYEFGRGEFSDKSPPLCSLADTICMCLCTFYCSYAVSLICWTNFGESWHYCSYCGTVFVVYCLTCRFGVIVGLFSWLYSLNLLLMAALKLILSWLIIRCWITLIRIKYYIHSNDIIFPWGHPISKDDFIFLNLVFYIKVRYLVNDIMSPSDIWGYFIIKDGFYFFKFFILY